MTKLKQSAWIAAGIVGMVFSVHAQTTYATSEEAQTAPPADYHEHLYHACEFSMDLYGVGILHDNDFENGARARRDLRWGGGAGVDYFFTRFIGVGADACAVTFHHSFVDTTTANLIVRFPIANTGLAPYIFGGAGYQFEGIDQIVGGGGAGLELRLVPHFGIFVDARYLAAAKTDGYGIGRAGVRLNF